MDAARKNRYNPKMKFKLMLVRLRDAFQGKAPLLSKRSREWPEIRRQHLQFFPNCAVCGGDKTIEVHHIEPFHLRPELELNLQNLITLCESKKAGVTCHQWFGHLGNYQLFNPTVVEDAATWKGKYLKARGR